VLTTGIAGQFQGHMQAAIIEWVFETVNGKSVAVPCNAVWE
jgi:hypothetical protein